MNALMAVSLTSLLLVFSITMTITEIYTCKYAKTKKKKNKTKPNKNKKQNQDFLPPKDLKL